MSADESQEGSKEMVEVTLIRYHKSLMLQLLRLSDAFCSLPVSQSLDQSVSH